MGGGLLSLLQVLLLGCVPLLQLLGLLLVLLFYLLGSGRRRFLLGHPLVVAILLLLELLPFLGLLRVHLILLLLILFVCPGVARVGRGGAFGCGKFADVRGRVSWSVFRMSRGFVARTIFSGTIFRRAIFFWLVGRSRFSGWHYALTAE